MRKETVALATADGEPIQTGWHNTKTIIRTKGKKKTALVPRKIPVFKGANASFARYLRSQRKRLASGKRCNVSPGYVK